MRFWAYLRSFLGHPPGDSTGCFRTRLCLLFLSFSSLNCSWLSIIHFFTSDLLARKRVCSPLDLTPRPWILRGFGALLERFWRGFGALLEVIHAFWVVFGDFERFWVILSVSGASGPLWDSLDSFLWLLWCFPLKARGVSVSLAWFWLPFAYFWSAFECFWSGFCWFWWFLMVSEWFWQLLRCFCGFFPVSPWLSSWFCLVLARIWSLLSASERFWVHFVGARW